MTSDQLQFTTQPMAEKWVHPAKTHETMAVLESYIKPKLMNPLKALTAILLGTLATSLFGKPEPYLLPFYKSLLSGCEFTAKCCFHISRISDCIAFMGKKITGHDTKGCADSKL